MKYNLNNEISTIDEASVIGAEVAMAYGRNIKEEYDIDRVKNICTQNLLRVAKTENEEISTQIKKLIWSKDFETQLKILIVPGIDFKLTEFLVDFHKNHRNFKPKNYEQEKQMLKSSKIKVLGENKEEVFAEFISELILMSIIPIEKECF